jgi:hypothetical protein
MEGSCALVILWEEEIQISNKNNHGNELAENYDSLHQ